MGTCQNQEGAFSRNTSYFGDSEMTQVKVITKNNPLIFWWYTLSAEFGAQLRLRTFTVGFNSGRPLELLGEL